MRRWKVSGFPGEWQAQIWQERISAIPNVTNLSRDTTTLTFDTEDGRDPGEYVPGYPFVEVPVAPVPLQDEQQLEDAVAAFNAAHPDHPIEVPVLPDTTEKEN